jgi:vesicle transport through interaction with t-SNAREs 1
MSNHLDTDAGSELFTNYEAELKLIQADLNQRLDSIPSLTGEERKSSLRASSRALDEAKELLDQLALEKSNIPSSTRAKANARYRNAQSDIDALSRRLKSLANNQSDRRALFGDRYTDEPGGDVQLEQRQQLLSGTERLGRSSQRLQESQRIALETESIGAGTLADLHQQRAVIENTHRNLQQSEGYVDRSVKTLRGMARR